MVSETSASRSVTSASRYQSTSSMFIRGLILRTSKVLAEAIPIANSGDPEQSDLGLHCLHMSHKEDACLILVNCIMAGCEH